MDMCYEGTLVMPSSYAVMNEEEMTYVEGGAVDVVGAIIAAFTICGFGYGAARAAGEITANNGVTIYEYEKVRPFARAAILGSFGIIAVVGFENGFYAAADY